MWCSCEGVSVYLPGENENGWLYCERECNDLCAKLERAHSGQAVINFSGFVLYFEGQGFDGDETETCKNETL